eukprot:CAMPEP_0168511046 /NCGR_PEP_ID=MMETSP0405-20121227/1864_1 /TAXON_ID=498012 /ORGANISM="Trichosphaerium sp, Strain Am-I-7 wt" /LENGTH=404 /DNA_ID=CAMNT_0008529073 /DNA_START=1 /DNA_END=1212 /DNA_ORIENTATION=+
MKKVLMANNSLSSLLLASNKIRSEGCDIISEYLMDSACSLRELDISKNSIGRSATRKLGKALAINYTTLSSLNISFNTFGTEAISKLASSLKINTTLEELNIAYTCDQIQLRDLSSLTNITSLNISNNDLGRIPTSIGYLKRLVSLDLSKNNLEELPLSLGNLTNLTKLVLDDNPLTKINQKIRKKGPDSIIKYYRDSLSISKKPWTKVKVVIIGSEKAGKTHLVRRLQKRKYGLDEMSTECIEVASIGSKSLALNVFDLGGSQVFRLTHRFFFSMGSVYIIVLDATKSQDESSSTSTYWIRQIKEACGLTIIKVNTHLDCVSSDDDYTVPSFEEPSTSLSKQLKLAPCFETTISCKTSEGIPKLRAKIREVAMKVPIFGQQIPKYYWDFEKKLSQRTEKLLYW